MKREEEPLTALPLASICLPPPLSQVDVLAHPSRLTCHGIFRLVPVPSLTKREDVSVWAIHLDGGA